MFLFLCLPKRKNVTKVHSALSMLRTDKSQTVVRTQTRVHQTEKASLIYQTVKNVWCALIKNRYGRFDLLLTLKLRVKLPYQVSKSPGGRLQNQYILLHTRETSSELNERRENRQFKDGCTFYRY